MHTGELLQSIIHRDAVRQCMHPFGQGASCHCHINDLVILVNFNFSSVSIVNLDSLYEKTYILTFVLHLYYVLCLRYGKISK